MASAEALSGGDAVDRLSWEIGGIRLELRGDRSVLVVSTGTLLAADLHLGKAEAFQQRGLNVPAGVDGDTLDRLAAAMAATAARELIVLGDLFHAPESLSPQRREELLSRVRQLAGARKASLNLVLGNHDRLDPTASGFAGAPVRAILEHASGLSLLHAPPARDQTLGPFAAGHLHPVARVSAPGERLRLPCFVLSEGGLILPAFGGFTGGAPMERSPSGFRVAAWDGALVDLDGADRRRRLTSL
jgi:DNA ligase-associated metallophosphoesterase